MIMRHREKGGNKYTKKKNMNLKERKRNCLGKCKELHYAKIILDNGLKFAGIIL